MKINAPIISDVNKKISVILIILLTLLLIVTVYLVFKEKIDALEQKVHQNIR